MSVELGPRPKAVGPDTGDRGFWPLRDLPVVGWLLAVVVVSALHTLVPAPRWLMIHLLVLGAAGHSILVWSRFFADTLVRLPPTPRAEQSRRLLLFNLGVLLVVVGVPGEWWWLVVLGAVGIGAAVLWHVVTLARGIRSRFASRFVGTLHFYIAAGSLLLIGITLGVWLARQPPEPLATRIRMAHVAINVLGWIGLSVLGTVVSLGPTMLRTRIVEGAERLSRRALWPLLGGIAVIVLATVLDAVSLVAVGLLLYAVGAGLVAWPVAQAGRRKPPASFPTWSLAAGLGWLVGLLVVLVIRVGVSGVAAPSGPQGWADLGAILDDYTPFLAAGFVAQVLLGALAYLVPVVLGGGPAAVRATNRDLDAGGALRVTVTNLSLLVCVLPAPSLVRALAAGLALLSLAAYVPILVWAIGRRHGRPADAHQPPAATARPAGQNPGMVAVGLGLVLVAVALGGALDPTALQGPVASAAAGVRPTGHTERVTITAANMRFTPSLIRVHAGDRLVITVRNTDAAQVHDLVLDTGAKSGRLAPGQHAVVNAGVVGRDIDGWCSVVGHRQLGMVMRIVATGRTSGSAPLAEGTLPGMTGMPGMTGTPGDAQAVPGGRPGPEAAIPDPVLPPLLPGRVHHETFTITQRRIEVAPGVTQLMWTYNGQAPGPTLHGRVGDTFVIRLVNHAPMGHSIDFHAGDRAPDQVMRTIPPGGSLTYRFTADRAGIWLYHCSTMPMSAHIANGMYGAVVIDPPGLRPVSRSFLIVQSEHYYGPQGQPLDVAKLLARRPDAVVFNGYYDGYDFRPLHVRVGERVRIWVLDAGPDEPLSFHVVGARFDTTYAEGRWLLGSARGPAPTGGSQALGLLPAQGGFVETTFREPGHYPLVNHVMIDAEHGAHGVIEVSP